MIEIINLIREYGVNPAGVIGAIMLTWILSTIVKNFFEVNVKVQSIFTRIQPILPAIIAACLCLIWKADIVKYMTESLLSGALAAYLYKIFKTSIMGK